MKVIVWCECDEAHSSATRDTNPLNLLETRYCCFPNLLADEATRDTNPLGLLCVECWSACILSQDGKRWNCPNGHGNKEAA